MGVEGRDPASKVSLFKETKRERFLLPEEVSASFTAVDAEENETIRDFIYIALLTGGRRSNVQAMRWPEIDFNQRVWNIPGSSAKMGDLVTIPLLPEALEILERRRKVAKEKVAEGKVAKTEWVFAGHGSSGHLVEPKSAWKRILKAADEVLKKRQEESGKNTSEGLPAETSTLSLSDLRLHDLRRTLGSWQAIMGSSLLVIGKSLGHKSVSATAIYAQLNDSPVRESMQKATTALLLAGKKKDSKT